MAKWILTFFPPHRTYCEPFAGMASCLMQKRRSPGEVINDLNDEIVEIYRVLRDRDLAAQLIEQIRLTPYARTEYLNSYEPGGDRIEQVRRTLFRLHAAFAGDCHIKTHISGFKTSPDGKQSCGWVNLPDKLGPVIERLQGVTIENRDALAVLKQYDTPESLFLVDPPYVLSTRSGGRTYRYEMDDEQHRALANALRSLSGMTILCGYPSVLYDDLYAGWHCVSRPGRTFLNQERTECLWISPQAHAALEATGVTL